MIKDSPNDFNYVYLLILAILSQVIQDERMRVFLKERTASLLFKRQAAPDLVQLSLVALKAGSKLLISGFS
jgi:hypothetical protein